METVVVWGLVAFVLAAALTAACKPLALRLGAVARPRADRWHREVIPLLGGVAIAAATTLPALASAAAGPAVWVLVGGAVALFLVGLVDDVAAVKPQTKLVAQLVVASAMVAFGLRFSLTGIPFVDTLITLLWIVGITNAFNLLDNMDGLAAGIAAIAAAFRGGLVLLDGDLKAAQLAAALLGATLGFLVHNRPPASIFMGDAGSMFLGCFVAGLSLTGGEAYSRGSASILLVPVLLLLVPIFDTTFVTVTRLLAGRPISVGGRDHTSHRLVALGLSEGRAVGILYVLAAAGGSVAVFSYHFGLSLGVVLVVLLALATAVLAVHLSRVHVHSESASPQPGATALARAVVDLPYKRQVANVAFDAVLIVVAYWSAYLLRFEGTLASEQALFVASLPIVLATQLAALFVSGTYAGIWRYTSLPDLLRLVQASAAGCVATIVALVLAFRFEGYSRAVFVLDWILLAGLLGASRVSLRLLAEVLRPESAGARRVLVYGAGDGGALALRKIRAQSGLERVVVGFLDDDPAKWGARIEGVRVLGGVESCPSLLARHEIAEVVVASGAIPPSRIASLLRACTEAGVEVARVTLRWEPLGLALEDSALEPRRATTRSTARLRAVGDAGARPELALVEPPRKSEPRQR